MDGWMDGRIKDALVCLFLPPPDHPINRPTDRRCCTTTRHSCAYQNSPPGSKPPTGRVGASVQAGDLLLSNHTSPLEVLYFASRFLPAFVATAGVAPQVGGQAVAFDPIQIHRLDCETEWMSVRTQSEHPGLVRAPLPPGRLVAGRARPAQARQGETTQLMGRADPIFYIETPAAAADPYICTHTTHESGHGLPPRPPGAGARRTTARRVLPRSGPVERRGRPRVPQGPVGKPRAIGGGDATGARARLCLWVRW